MREREGEEEQNISKGWVCSKAKGKLCRGKAIQAGLTPGILTYVLPGRDDIPLVCTRMALLAVKNTKNLSVWAG